MRRKWGWRAAVVAATLFAFAPVSQVLAATGSGVGTVDDNISSAVVGEGFIATEGDAPDGASAQSTAEFQIDAGALSLDAVPNLVFGAVKLDKINAGGVTTDLVLSSPSAPTARGFDGNQSRQLIVSDFRGTSGGWTLTADFTRFTTGTQLERDPAAITTGNLALRGTIASPNNLDTNNELIVSGAYNTTNVFWNAPAGRGQGTNNATIESGSMVLEQNYLATPGTHVATITWSLGATPAVTAPEG